jgi:hypothetical protein
MRSLAATAAAFIWLQASLCALAGLGVSVTEGSGHHAGPPVAAASQPAGCHERPATEGSQDGAVPLRTGSSAPETDADRCCREHCDLFMQTLLAAPPVLSAPATPPLRLDAARFDVAAPARAVREAGAWRMPPAPADILLELSILLI